MLRAQPTLLCFRCSSRFVPLPSTGIRYLSRPKSPKSVFKSTRISSSAAPPPMSSQRTVADVLMCAARAAAEKKAKKNSELKDPSSPPAKKPKTLKKVVDSNPEKPSPPPQPETNASRATAISPPSPKKIRQTLKKVEESKPERPSPPPEPESNASRATAISPPSPKKNRKTLKNAEDTNSEKPSPPPEPESNASRTTAISPPSPKKNRQTLKKVEESKPEKPSPSSEPETNASRTTGISPPSPKKNRKTLRKVVDSNREKPSPPPEPESNASRTTGISPPSPKKNRKTLKNVEDTNSEKPSPPPQPESNASPTTDISPPSPKKNGKTARKQEGKGPKQVLPELDKKNVAVELKKKGSDFNPRAVASWKNGQPVPFLFLAHALDLISNETGRIVITDILSNVFSTVMATTPDDLTAVVYLSANKIAPPHEGVELGIGDASIIRALAEAYGRKEEHVKKQLKELGDLGLVAKASRLSQRMMFKPPPLTVVKVLDTFRKIAKESGKDSQDKKRSHIKGLLVAAADCEPQYIIRLLQSKMRIGLAEQTVLAALGQAAAFCDTLPAPPSRNQSSIDEAAKIIKQVYSVLPNHDKIVQNLLRVGVWKLSEVCRFTLGVPVRPMLAKPTKGVSEILDKFQGIEFTCEYKYDGERAQIHFMEDGSVEIYSRNAERNTTKYPDVVNAISRFKKPFVKSFVLDCEIVAYDHETQKISSFQKLSTRARKEVNLSDIKVQVCTFAFDILYINGQPLLQEELKVRREHLYDSFVETPGTFHFATAITSNDLDEIQKFLDSAVNSSCEGLIIKTLDRDATYEPSKRSNNWLKLKKDYMDSIGDTLDLVPIAAFHGRGKRTGVYGSFLLACYDEENEEYHSICNIGTGFSESMLEERSASLRNKVTSSPKPYYRYGDTTSPDVWFEPVEVWEVKAADLSISPVHRAAFGIVDKNKGISLRFPRLVRVREDKNPDQATTSEQVADMYRNQKINHANNEEEDDDD